MRHRASKEGSVVDELYPEIGAGGFTRVDGTVTFFTRVNALLEPDMIVVDFGAGRGAGELDDTVRYRRDLRRLKGKVSKVIGFDIDPVVLGNPTLDEAHVIQPGASLPNDDATVDLIVSDNTLEHIEKPEFVAREFSRILKPGGWICARTPNKWGYVGIGSRLIPEALHSVVLRVAQPDRKEEDVFPKFYRLNTMSAIRQYFPQQRFENFSYIWNAEPSYAGSSKVARMMMIGAFRVMPNYFGTTIHVFLKKRTFNLEAGG